MKPKAGQNGPGTGLGQAHGAASFSLRHDNPVECIYGQALLLHGLTGSPAEMRPLADYLFRTGFDVEAPLLSGHGGSIADFRITPAASWIEDSEKALENCLRNGNLPIFIIGLSLGALLALHLACRYQEAVSRVATISPPTKLRSWGDEFFLSLLSLLPEASLNGLGVRKKKARRPGCHAFPHMAFPVYSLGASARYFRIKRTVLKEAGKVHCPVLICSDPRDHLISETAGALLSKHLKNALVTMLEFPGGEHELLIGPKHQQVFESILAFGRLRGGNTKPGR